MYFLNNVILNYVFENVFDQLQRSLWYSKLDFGVSYGIFTLNKREINTDFIMFGSKPSRTTAPPSSNTVAAAGDTG